MRRWREQRKQNVNYQLFQGRFFNTPAVSALLLVLLVLAGVLMQKHVSQAASAKGNYAQVNGLKLYYEVHGSDSTNPTLVLLHGAFGFAEAWSPVLPTLADTRRVIVVELQGHGHTADRDQPLSYEQMADDTAELLKQLKIKSADFFGYSMGGTVALGVAVRHPELARKVAILGSTARSPRDTYEPEFYREYQSLPADFAPPELKNPYDKTSPDPTHWPVLVQKIKEMGPAFKGYSNKELKEIKAQVLIMIGDREGVRLEHAVEMYRVIPNAQLAIFPHGDHFMIFQSPDKVLATLVPFLDAPLPNAS
jgi:pimeloyl-ACP methyl ester carboxylesterase